jgi:hypothetical protein
MEQVAATLANRAQAVERQPARWTWWPRSSPKQPINAKE